MPNWGSRRLLGVGISVAPLAELTERAKLAVAARARFVMACANPHSLVVAQSDAVFQEALSTCDAVLGDGVGVNVACRLAGIDAVPRITGYDFFNSIMAELDRTGGTAYFFGSSAEVLARVASRAQKDFPRVGVSTLSPPFGQWSEQENEAMVAQIEARRPDVLWVGMTAPRQEKWVHENAVRLTVPVIGSIGAVFDYYAGTVQRAPAWYCEHGLEWLYRLLREPQRLWRRTLVSAPRFLWLVLRQRVTAQN